MIINHQQIKGVILDNNKKILGLTSNPANIKIPYRGGGLNNKNSNLLLRSPNLKITNYNDFVNYNFSNIVLTSGAQPFQEDYSDILTKNILNCEKFNIQLKQAAVQFSYTHSIVSSSILGMTSPEQVKDNINLYNKKIDKEFWKYLKDNSLVSNKIPI